MARTRKGSRPGPGKRHNGKATLSSGQPVRAPVRMTIVEGDATSTMRATKQIKLGARGYAGEFQARPAAAVNGHRRTSEDTQIAEELDLDAPEYPAAPLEVASTSDDGRRRLNLGWGRSLRFARAAAWALPAGAFGFALAGMWGWPTPTGPASSSAGTWLITMLVSLALALVGGVALTALLGATAGRQVGSAALVLMLSGTVVFVPVLGIIGVARPAIAGLPAQIRPAVAGDLDGRLLEGTIVRWLGIGGLSLLGAGWFLMGCAVLLAGIVNRVDGLLLMASVAVAVTAAYLSWQFLLVIAAMIMVAAGLGLAWTAWRLTPDGEVPDDDFT
jgi:Amt family ammonium transporter